jgi:sodium/bile acid cotransporter 7
MSDLEEHRPLPPSSSETSAKAGTQDTTSTMESSCATATRDSVGKPAPEEGFEITSVLPDPVRGVEKGQEDASHIAKRRSPKLQKTLNILKWFIKDQWFLVAMGFVILLASQVQVPEARQQSKRVIVTYVAVSVIL